MKNILQRILLLITFIMFSGTAIYAEESRDSQVNELMNEFAYHKTSVQQNPTTQINTERMMLIEANMQNVQITAALYAFSLIIIIILMRITRHEAKDLVTIVGLLSVIFGTILLVLMVGNTEQLTAPMGILGAIAGYLFGSNKKTEGLQEE